MAGSSNMYGVLAALASFLFAGCAVVSPTIAEQSPASRPISALPQSFQQLQGTWIVSVAQRGSTPMSEKIGARAHFEDNRFWFEGDRGHEIFDVDTSAAPFRIDFWERGTAVQGVYRIEGDVLSVCSAPPGISRPAGFDPRAHPGYILFEARRERAVK